MSNPAIEFQGVTKVFRRRLRGQEICALTNVSFNVSSGEVCAFLGPNGAGKTTSINILMGFLNADFGEICVLGYPPGDVRGKRQIGFVPENFAFYKYLDAEKLLRFHAGLAGLQSVEMDSIIPKLLTAVKLQEYGSLKIGKYSRGMVQRLGIAQALLGDPQLLVLDEPTSGLDPAGRKEVRDLVLSLKAAGKTVFLSSHNLSEVEQICDRVIIINRGRVAGAGTLQEMLGPAERVEIVVDRLPEHLEPLTVECGAVVEKGPQGVRILVATARKRELSERLWAAGSDIISIMPVKNSLEDLFLDMIGDRGGPA